MCDPMGQPALTCHNLRVMQGKFGWLEFFCGFKIATQPIKIDRLGGLTWWVGPILLYLVFDLHVVSDPPYNDWLIIESIDSLWNWHE